MIIIIIVIIIKRNKESRKKKIQTHWTLTLSMLSKVFSRHFEMFYSYFWGGWVRQTCRVS